MAASFLENELEQLIKKKLIGTSNEIAELFEFNGPLGTFSSKIKLAYSIGLISKDVRSDIELIRKIRNEFGHDYKPIHFNTAKIKNRILNLKAHYHDTLTAKPRQIFNNTVLAILAEIHSETAIVEKFSIKPSIARPSEAKKEIFEHAKQFADMIVRKIETSGSTLSSQDEVKLVADELLKIFGISDTDEKK